MENWKFDISDVISEASPLYATRALPGDQLKNKAIAAQPPSVTKEIYTLATVFSDDLRAVMYKITQTLVKIGQKEEGYNTMQHLCQQLYDISSNQISRYTLTYFMDKMVEVFQNKTAVKNIEEIFETIQDLMQRDLRNWHFLLPFLNDLNNNPNLIEIIEAGLAELKFIMDNEARKSTLEALFVMIENGFKDVEPVPLDGTKGPAAVKVEVAAASKGSPAPVSSIGKGIAAAGPIPSVRKDGVVPAGSSASVSKVAAVPTTGSITSVSKASGTATAASASKDVGAVRF